MPRFAINQTVLAHRPVVISLPGMRESRHPLRQVAARAEERLGHRQALERACRKKPRRAVVHDFRTETRRLLAALRVLKAALPRTDWKAACKLLKGQLDATSDLRDLQVQKRSVQRLAAERRELEPLRKELARRERKERRTVRDELAHRRHPHRMRSFVKALGELTTTGIPDERRAERDMQATLRRAGVRIARLQRNAGEDPDRLHRLRVAVKEYRYMAEAVTGNKSAFAALHRGQSCLGEIHDLELLEDRIRQFACAHPGNGTHDATLRLLTRRREQRQRAQRRLLATVARSVQARRFIRGRRAESSARE